MRSMDSIMGEIATEAAEAVLDFKLDTAPKQPIKERPILFGPWKMRRILKWDFEKDGDMQTRRVIKDGPKGNFWGKPQHAGHRGLPWFVEANLSRPSTYTFKPCPYGKVGDRLWVRETHWPRPERSARDMRDGADTWPEVIYEADSNPWERTQLVEWGWKRKPSIFMPRKFSRVTLEITGVKVERLQDISPRDCVAEGVKLRRWIDEDAGKGLPFFDHGIEADGRELRNTFMEKWDELNGKRKGCAWSDNPWLWCLSFRRLRP